MTDAARPFKAMDSFRPPPKNARFLATDASIPRGAIMLNRAISDKARVNSPHSSTVISLSIMTRLMKAMIK